MADDFSWYSIKVEGVKELEDVLKEMADDVGYKQAGNKVLKPALESAVQPVRLKLFQDIPYDDSKSRRNKNGPHMRDTIRAYAKVPSARDRRSVYVDANDAMIGVVEIKTDKRGISQEFGNARTPAQPYLRNALEGSIDESLRRFKGYMSWALGKYKSKKV